MFKQDKNIQRRICHSVKLSVFWHWELTPWNKIFLSTRMQLDIYFVVEQKQELTWCDAPVWQHSGPVAEHFGWPSLCAWSYSRSTVSLTPLWNLTSPPRSTYNRQHICIQELSRILHTDFKTFSDHLIKKETDRWMDGQTDRGMHTEGCTQI